MSGLSSFAIEFFSAAILLSLPLLIYRSVYRLLHSVIDEEIYQVPILFILSRLVGFIWAVLALAGGLGERAFRLSEIFTPESIWNIPARTFLFREGNLFSNNLIEIGRWVVSGDSVLISIAGIVFVLAALLATILCLTMFRSDALRVTALAACITTTTMTAWQSVYLTTVTLWLIHRVNFWSLLLVALYIQYRRTPR
jgi:hypothetical protein